MKATPMPYDIENEVVLTRVIDAPLTRVFAAWTDPEDLPVWFGPAGFSCKTHAIDIREGGHWHFDMTGPDGTLFPNWMEFLEIVPDARIVTLHGARRGDQDAHRVTVTFDSQSNGKTVVTLRQLHTSPERRAAVIGFGAVELGLQTLDKLAARVAD